MEIQGTRLAVGSIIGLLAEGWTEDEILRNYSWLKQEGIRACLAYASARLEAESVSARIR